MTKSSDAVGVLMLDLEGSVLTPLEQELLQRPAVGGLILFSRNYVSTVQLQELVAAIRESDERLLITVDQEGGRVQRFRDGFLALPPAHAFGLLAGTDPERAQTAALLSGWAMAAELLQYGIDFSLAPVLDLYRADNRAIANRAFSGDVDTVVSLARAYIAGMNEAGMAATGKHFPGHGTVVADSHAELPVDPRTWEELLASDFTAFAGCIDVLDAVMPAHVIYPAVDTECAGYSEVWIKQKLRKQLGFEGVVFSDDLTMAAAHGAGSVVQRAKLALGAGCDMVLVCNDRESAITVADWLDTNNIPPNAGLLRMRGRPQCEGKNLYTSARWIEATEMMSTLTGNKDKVN